MTKSLKGRRIVVTRARCQAAELCEGLRLRGALPIELPTIELRDPESFESLDRAVAELEGYDWVLFTSANAVEKFFARMNAAGRTASDVAAASVRLVRLPLPSSSAAACNRTAARPNTAAKACSRRWPARTSPESAS